MDWPNSPQLEKFECVIHISAGPVYLSNIDASVCFMRAMTSQELSERIHFERVYGNIEIVREFMEILKTWI